MRHSGTARAVQLSSDTFARGHFINNSYCVLAREKCVFSDSIAEEDEKQRFKGDFL
jgi:hypothetical protein